MVAEILEGLRQAALLIASGDPEVLQITARSIEVSGLATALATCWGLPIGLAVGMSEFRGKRLVKGVFNALLGMPAVALGLILYLLLSRSGPFGFLHLLYSPLGIAVGQSILVTPIVVSFTLSAIEALDPQIKDLVKTLGAGDFQASIIMCKEARQGIILAIASSFNRAIAELGIALMIGGNIKNLTRVLTTAIALGTDRGEVVLSIALAIILMSIVFTLNLALNLVQRRG